MPDHTSAPRMVSSRPCPTLRVAYRDEWVGYTGGLAPNGLPYELCFVCINWHEQIVIDTKAP